MKRNSLIHSFYKYDLDVMVIFELDLESILILSGEEYLDKFKIEYYNIESSPNMRSSKKLKTLFHQV